MIKEKNYLIKSINYNIDTYSENSDKISVSSNNLPNKNIIFNEEKNLIIPSISARKNNFNEEKIRYNVLKSLEVKKDTFNSFTDEIELSFEKYNTLLNNDTYGINKENIYKKILDDNKKDEKIIRPIKIIKCEKIKISNKNTKIDKTINKKNHVFLETKSKNNNDKKHLALKTDIINNNLKDICFKKNKENKYKIKKIDNHSFYNDKYIPVISNKKEENHIILNHSITFINHKNKEKNDLNKHKSLVEKNDNNELANKIKKKGYMDIKDFMEAINKENMIKKKIENENNKLNNQRKIKVNKNNKIINKNILCSNLLFIILFIFFLYFRIIPINITAFFILIKIFIQIFINFIFLFFRIIPQDFKHSIFISRATFKIFFAQS